MIHVGYADTTVLSVFLSICIFTSLNKSMICSKTHFLFYCNSRYFAQSRHTFEKKRLPGAWAKHTCCAYNQCLQTSIEQALYRICIPQNNSKNRHPKWYPFPWPSCPGIALGSLDSEGGFEIVLSCVQVPPKLQNSTNMEPKQQNKPYKIMQSASKATLFSRPCGPY